MGDATETELKLIDEWAGLLPDEILRRARVLTACTLRKKLEQLPGQDRRVHLALMGISKVLNDRAIPPRPDPLITQASKVIEAFS